MGCVPLWPNFQSAAIFSHLGPQEGNNKPVPEAAILSLERLKKGRASLVLNSILKDIYLSPAACHGIDFYIPNAFLSLENW